MRPIPHQPQPVQEPLSQEQKLAWYATLIDNAHDLIHGVSPDGAFLFVNQAWRDTLGYSEEDLRHLRLMDIVDASCRDKCRYIFRTLIEGGRFDRTETVFVARDGRRIMVEGRCTTIFENGRAVAMTGIFRDITDRCRHEEALRESEERFRDLFENATDLIQMLQPDGRLLYVNRAWRETFGYGEEEIPTLSIFNLIAPDCIDHCHEVFQRVLAEEKVHQIHSEFQTRDGRKILIEGNASCRFRNGVPLYTQCIFRDVTEKTRLAEELLKRQRIESIEVLAGGIAHDFNNLLTAVLGNISLAKRHLDPGHPAWERLTETEKASRRAQHLTRQLLAFAKGGAPVKVATSAREVICDSASFPLAGTRVRCAFELAEDLLPLEADPGQIGQVIQNIVLNAAQSMPEGGTVTIRAGNFQAAPGALPGLPAGPYVRIEIIDHGHGIPREDLGRVFDPYFTSKESGSGLGLTVAEAIIGKHGGRITVDSEPGRGTTFTLLLPATEKCPLCPAGPGRQDPPHLGKARVLLMDDEKMVRDLAAAMLQHFGLEVETAENGQEAVRAYRQAMATERPFDVVIMDLTIPGGMGGQETLAQLRRIDPAVRAVVSSGYASDPVMANHEAYGFCGVMPKPFTVEQLSRILASVLLPKTAAAADR
ncbi:MAG: PAS domain S-box protein [Thermodesulfobacteriota bacterium]